MELTAPLALGVPLSARMAPLFTWGPWSSAPPAVQYRLSETVSGCRVELDYLRSDAQRRRLLWE